MSSTTSAAMPFSPSQPRMPASREPSSRPLAAGGGNSSPSMRRSSAVTPACTAPGQSPARRRGTMYSLMMRPAAESGIAPSRP
ncbi:Uncharacterised protein [Bordetella pertussis]|nr:Uncharacterised protein [Bordetella pertussis]CPM22753.1 Uncharacterised protein [Bordetella pertussis]